MSVKNKASAPPEAPRREQTTKQFDDMTLGEMTKDILVKAPGRLLGIAVEAVIETSKAWVQIHRIFPWMKD